MSFTRRSRAFWACLLLAAAGLDVTQLLAAESTLEIGEVEAQPLAANVKRIIETLKFLGSPLPAGEVEKLQAAAKDRDAKQLQKLLDPRVLLLAHINPESRVKVRRGPAAAELQQFRGSSRTFVAEREPFETWKRMAETCSRVWP